MSDLYGLFTYIFQNINFKKIVFLYLIFVFINSEYFPVGDLKPINSNTMILGLFLILFYLIIEILININLL